MRRTKTKKTMMMKRMAKRMKGTRSRLKAMIKKSKRKKMITSPTT